MLIFLNHFNQMFIRLMVITSQPARHVCISFLHAHRGFAAALNLKGPNIRCNSCEPTVKDPQI